ncbi:PBSX family phage terminase large subunit [Clostridium magnum]|uniref:PBSX family phage terminase large subunit n=1 Tax=Clostridium magnum TaxID=33954 RepID=UPI0009227BE0|nr:PBSX family phage terminase large subunit [Clostridium magnum]SHJ12786.1 phage terminase, large subunit, PBSX family [Clostridium magnum DSM 2767]
MRKKVKLARPFVNPKYRFMFEKDYVPHKYNIFYGGTGSSKSFSIITLFVEMCLKYKTFDILVARKYATTLHDTVEMPVIDMMVRRFQNKLSGSGLVEGRDFTYNRTLKHIKFSTGSIIRFKGYDNPEKLKGIDNVNVLWMEEVTDFTQDDLEDIQDRLRATPPSEHPWGTELKVFMSFNPIFKTHWIRTYFFKDEIDMTDEVHKDIVIDPVTTFAIKTTWRDNLYYNGQYKDEKLRKKMKLKNPRKYGVQCNGNWGVLGELIYENWEVIKCEKDLSWYDDISCGLDFGFGHNTAFHLLGAKDSDVYAIKEYYKPQVTVSDIIRDLKTMFPYVKEIVRNIKEKDIDKDSDITEAMQIFYRLKDMFSGRCKLEIFNQQDIEERDINIDGLIEELQEGLGIPYCELRIYADNARPEAIEEMKRAGFTGIRPCTKGDGSVLEGIEWLQDRTIYIDESCIGLRNETESYQWAKDKKTGDRLPKPVKVNDDAEDSLRYGTEGFRNPKRFRITTF